MYSYTFFNCSTDKDSPRDDVMRNPCLSSTHYYQIVALMSDKDAIYVPQSCGKMYDLEPVLFLWIWRPRRKVYFIAVEQSNVRKLLCIWPEMYKDRKYLGNSMLTEYFQTKNRYLLLNFFSLFQCRPIRTIPQSMSKRNLYNFEGDS